MSQVIVDDTMGARFDSCKTPVDICDRTGRVLGKFVPAQPLETISAPADRRPYTEEQLEAMRRETGGRSLSEIWKSLGRMPQPRIARGDAELHG